MSNIRELWNQIEQALKEISPEIANSFDPGASSSEIADVETILGYSLPEDIRSLLECVNGQDPSSALVNGFRLLSCKEIAKSWEFFEKMGDEMHPAVSPEILPKGVQGKRGWNREWIFLLKELGGSEKITVDCTPTPSTGPLFFWDNYMIETEVVSTNLVEFLSTIQINLSENKFTIEGKEIDMKVANNFE